MIDDREEAIMAALQGVPVDVLAEELNVTEATIYRWMREGGHSTQARKMREREIVDTYVNTDKGVFDIADEFEIGTYTLYQILHKHDAPLRRPYRSNTPATNERVIEMYQQGYKVSDIRDETGRCFNTIYDILKDHGIRTRRYSTSRGE